MKTTLLAAVAALGVALAAPAFASIDHYQAVTGGDARLASTNSEGNGGSNPYASPMPSRPRPDPATASLSA